MPPRRTRVLTPTCLIPFDGMIGTVRWARAIGLVVFVLFAVLSCSPHRQSHASVNRFTMPKLPYPQPVRSPDGHRCLNDTALLPVHHIQSSKRSRYSSSVEAGVVCSALMETIFVVLLVVLFVFDEWMSFPRQSDETTRRNLGAINVARYSDLRAYGRALRLRFTAPEDSQYQLNDTASECNHADPRIRRSHGCCPAPYLISLGHDALSHY